MPQIILKINTINDKIYQSENICCYLADASLPEKFLQELKKTGKTLIDRMNELYSQYGYYKDALDSYTLKGKDGLANIASMMRELRCGEPLFSNVEKVLDYKEGVDAEPGFGKLPSSDVLKYILNDGSWIAIRPSGTEPKIKIYYSIKSEGETQAVEKLDGFRKVIGNRLGLQGE